MEPTDRRTFLRAAAGAACTTLLGTDPAAGAPETPQPCAPGAWQKYGIVLEPTEPWEHGNIQNFTCTAEPLRGDAWRLWYSVSGSASTFNLAYAEGVPGQPFRKVPAVCTPGDPADAPFAIGNLPADWHPVQGVHVRLRSGRHRLYFWAHGPRVVRYLAAESADGRRYRVLDPLRPVLYHPADRAAHGVPSPDGVMMVNEPSKERPADEPPAVPRLISNDATNVYLLPDGTFEMYSVALVRVPPGDPAYVAHDNAAGLVRVIDRYTSGDGLHFETRARAIARDAADPADQQFYYLSATRTPRGRVGMLGHYRVEAQTMDIEWCFSRDGLRWERPLRKAWIPRGDPPAPDCYGIYAGSTLVRRGGKWHLFYTGVNSSHNGKQTYGTPRQVVMYATADDIWSKGGK